MSNIDPKLSILGENEQISVKSFSHIIDKLMLLYLFYLLKTANLNDIDITYNVSNM